jgi:WD40 repeat protein
MTPISRILLATVVTMACDVASAKDYSAYYVVDKTELDMMAGPANTALLLSPDGSRLLHVASDICLLAPADQRSWSRVGCGKNEPGFRLGPPEDLLWSPDGARMVMPTYNSALLAFRDTDIRLLDPRTLTVSNLTDDGLDDSLFDNPAAGNLDIIARWVDDDTIAFLRYPITKAGAGKGGPPSIMTIDAAGGAPKVLLTNAGADRLAVYALAVSSDGRRLAYSFDDKDQPEVAGIYLLDIGNPAPQRAASMAAVGAPPRGLAFSPDGKFLLLLGENQTGIDARVLDLATGKVVPVDATRNVTGVAWSPTGSALAWVTNDREKAGEPGGLFLANRPGEPGRQLLKGALMSPVCCFLLPFTWAANDTMVLGNIEKMDAPLFVRVGE